MTQRRVVARTELVSHQVTPGFSSYGLRAGGPIELDPFLNLDDFTMSQPTFPPHPHAGFSAITYMFEDSPGAFVNRDSLGDRSLIEPGAFHWTQAARGMMHEEVPEHPGVRCHGLQMFVNLREVDKLADLGRSTSRRAMSPRFAGAAPACASWQVRSRAWPRR